MNFLLSQKHDLEKARLYRRELYNQGLYANMPMYRTETSMYVLDNGVFTAFLYLFDVEFYFNTPLFDQNPLSEKFIPWAAFSPTCSGSRTRRLIPEYFYCNFLLYPQCVIYQEIPGPRHTMPVLCLICSQNTHK